MHIVYAVTTCSDVVYKRLFSQTKIKPAFQSQKYHRLLIEGLSAHTQVDVVANPPVNRSVLSQPVVRLEEETIGNARYHNIHAYRNPIRKAIHVCMGTFMGVLKYAHRDSAVVIDCLNSMAGLSAQLAAKLKGCRCVGIITDLPDMLGQGMSAKIANYVIRHCTDYVLLTEAMNDYIQNPGRPYVVLEGHADIAMEALEPSLDKKGNDRIILYAGSLSRKYGLGDLVDGFRQADLPNTRLHIYGAGDYAEELEAIAKEDPRIYYGGMLLSGEVVPKELEATLLVNPRPTNEEFVKYSFPSKTMEYMATGTPVLTTVLPGLPKEYYPHVYFIKEENASGIARALQQTLAASDEELLEKGLKAREFVLKERNNIVQAEKILAMLKR